MGGLTLTQEEQARLKVLNCILEHQMEVGEAAYVLGLSERHTWRILAAYRRDGAASLAHGNRGRQPANATSEAIRRQVLTFATTSYQGFNHTHLTEILAEREGLALSRSSVRRILLDGGIKSPRNRRPPRHRMRRERMSEEGMLLQLDGSFHDWLEARGPWLTLLLAVDDATGKVPYAIFRKHEDTFGYFLLFDGIVRQHGIPLAIYSDRSTVFKAPNGSLVAMQRGTQFGRALEELGVKQVFARSPQAKGRVERMAGTFQDRLVSELRLAGACTETEANRVLWEFLPRFNQRFAVLPADAESAYRPLSPDVDLDAILCFKHVRRVARDNTVKYRWRTLQILPKPGEASWSGVLTEVQERLDGSLVLYCNGRVVPTRAAPPRPGLLRVTVANRSDAGVPELPDRAHGACTRAEDQALRGPDSYLGRGALKPERYREPTPRQIARWNAIRGAKDQGLSLRAIARVLGISRNTVRKYLGAAGPPLNRARPSRTAIGFLPEAEELTDIIAAQ